MSSGAKKKEPRYACLNEAKASHSQRMWAEVSSFIPHLPHNGLSSSPSMWRYLLRVLCPVRRPVTALHCVLLTPNPLTWKIWWAPNNVSKWQIWFNSAFKGLKDRNLALAPRQGPEIRSRVLGIAKTSTSMHYFRHYKLWLRARYRFAVLFHRFAKFVTVSVYGCYFIEQLSVTISYRLVYRINIAHTADIPHTWRSSGRAW